MKFALTLKYNCPPKVTVDKSSYDLIFSTFEKYGITLTHLNSELDSHLRLHYHGIADIPKGFYRKKLCIKPYHVNLLPLSTQGDLDRWVKYCYKDVPPEDWPDLCDDPAYQIKSGIKDKLRGNIFRCCNNNEVTIKT